MNSDQIIAPVLNRNLIFVHGKGGVGKTSVSKAIAHRLATEGAPRGEKVLWITLEDPTRPAGELKKISPHLWELNCDFTEAFEEYAAMKIGATRLTQLFLKNKLIRYLAKAAPGVHELVLLGKIWFERTRYNHVIVDMPSTGYGLALFQSTDNFSKLFKTGPLYKDAESMLESFRTPDSAGHLIIALPEETPLRESLELNQFLLGMFPKNPAALIVNRLYPKTDSSSKDYGQNYGNPNAWPTPFASTAAEYVQKRTLLERYNMRLWNEEKIPYGELEYIPPPLHDSGQSIVKSLAEQLQKRNYLP
jgi:hypothetical protein